MFVTAGVIMKLNIFIFSVDKIDYLGHVLRQGGLEIRKHKKKYKKGLSEPIIITELTYLLGIFHAFRLSVPKLYRIEAPVNEELRKYELEWFGALIDVSKEVMKYLKEMFSPILELT